MITKQCPNCERELSLDSFYVKKTSRDGYEITCKKCINARLKKPYRKKLSKQKEDERNKPWLNGDSEIYC